MFLASEHRRFGGCKVNLEGIFQIDDITIIHILNLSMRYLEFGGNSTLADKSQKVSINSMQLQLAWGLINSTAQEVCCLSIAHNIATSWNCSLKECCFLQEKVGVLSRGQNAYFILQSSKFESEPNILIYCTINFLRRYGFDKCDVPLPSFTGIVLSAVWLEFL